MSELDKIVKAMKIAIDCKLNCELVAEECKALLSYIEELEMANTVLQDQLDEIEGSIAWY